MKGSFRKCQSFGKRQEYSAVAELLKRGFDVYMTLVDDSGIDCVIKINSKRYLDIQIKASSKTATKPMDFGAVHLHPRDNYYFIIYIEKLNKYYIIPTLDFARLFGRTTKGRFQGAFNLVIPDEKNAAYKRKNFGQYASFDVLK